MHAGDELDEAVVLVQLAGQGVQVLNGGVGAGQGDAVSRAADAVEHPDGQVGMGVQDGGGDGGRVGGRGGGEGPEGAEPVQAFAQAEVDGLHPAHGQAGHGAAVPVRGVDGVGGLHGGQEVLPKLLVKEVIGGIILRFPGPAVRGHHDERADLPAVDQVVHDLLDPGGFGRQAPFRLAAADAVAEDQQVVGVLRVVAGGEVDVGGLLIEGPVRRIVVGLVGEPFHRAAVFAVLQVAGGDGVLHVPAQLGPDGRFDVLDAAEGLQGGQRAAALQDEIEVVGPGQLHVPAVFLHQGAEQGGGGGGAFQIVHIDADGQLALRHRFKSQDRRPFPEIKPLECQGMLRRGRLRLSVQLHFVQGVQPLRPRRAQHEQENRQAQKQLFHGSTSFFYFYFDRDFSRNFLIISPAYSAFFFLFLVQGFCPVTLKYEARERAISGIPFLFQNAVGFGKVWVLAHEGERSAGSSIGMAPAAFP